jgi:hypothetical protein
MMLNGQIGKPTCRSAAEEKKHSRNDLGCGGSSVPEWKQEIRLRLANLKLEPALKATIISVLVAKPSFLLWRIAAYRICGYDEYEGPNARP